MTTRRRQAHRTVTEWMDDHPLTTYLLIILVVAVPGFIRTEQIDQEQDEWIECVARWGDEFTSRTVELYGLASERTTALDAMVRDLVVADPDIRREHFQDHLNEYIEASDRYNEALASEPIPEPPELRCGEEIR